MDKNDRILTIVFGSLIVIAGALGLSLGGAKIKLPNRHYKGDIEGYSVVIQETVRKEAFHFRELMEVDNDVSWTVDLDRISGDFYVTGEDRNGDQKWDRISICYQVERMNCASYTLEYWPEIYRTWSDRKLPPGDYLAAEEKLSEALKIVGRMEYLVHQKK